MNTLKLPNVWKKVSLFESTSFNNNMTKKITEYIKQYQTIFLLLLTTTSLQKKRVTAIHAQRPLLIKQSGVFVLSFVFIGYMDQLFVPIRFLAETYPLHNDNQRGDDDKRTPTKCVISCCVI